MFLKNLFGLAIIIVVLALAAWFYHYVDEETDPPFEPAQSEDSTG